MTINSIPNLRQAYSAQDQDKSIRTLVGFNDPLNSINQSLKNGGTITAIFKKELESGKAKLEINGTNPDELSFRTNALPIVFMDPKSKLKSLIEEGKITQIHGNCTVDQAQVILLDDTNHLDKEKQQIIRGKVANALKGCENIYLCEANPSNKIDFKQIEINHYFAPNLELNQGGSKDYLSGWDDSSVHKQSLQAITRGLQQIKLSNLNSSAPTNEDMALSGLKDLADVVGKMSDLRTESLWNTLQEKHRVFPEAKIIVFGGADHLRDKWLHEKLINQNLRFVEITPNSVEITPNSDNGKSEVAKVEKYYQIDKYSIWGNRK